MAGTSPGPTVTFPATEHCHCPLVIISHPDQSRNLSWPEPADFEMGRFAGGGKEGRKWRELMTAEQGRDLTPHLK